MLIYGDGVEKINLQKIKQERKLYQKVKLMGSHENIFSKEFDCAGFILPSYSEGVPNTLIEAMSVVLPCIATDW